MKEGKLEGAPANGRSAYFLSLPIAMSISWPPAPSASAPCPPCSSTDTDTSESASSFLSAAFYSNKEELSAKVERESVLARLSYRVID